MNYYIHLIVPAVFVIIPLAAFVYYIIFKSIKKKREVIPFWRVISEYLLVAWFMLLIYITQLMPFGESQAANWRPFYFFVMAIRYERFNSEMILQFLLNALMFAPFGFLLPMAFPGKFGRGLWVILFGLLLSVGVEALQLIGMRGCDVDDVIANTMGVIYGYLVYAVLRKIYAPETWERNRRE